MNKYIDSEKLIAEIERQQRGLAVLSLKGTVDIRRDSALQNGVYNYILDLITSLQQEQPEKTLTFDGFVDKVGNWFAHLRLDKFRKTFNGEIFPATQLVQEYDLFVRELSKTYSDKQEQPEVDLEKEIENYWDRLCDDEFGEIIPRNVTWFDDIARHFYELGQSEMRKRITNPARSKTLWDK